MTAFAARNHKPFILHVFVSAYTWTMIIRNDGTFATLRADIFSALIKKYIVRLVCNLIKSSWLIPDGFRITTLGGGVRNSFPFCRLFDSIQGSSVTINVSYIKTAGEGNNSLWRVGFHQINQSL